MEALKSLKVLVKEEKIRIMKADKGSKTVIMDNKCYENKCIQMLNTSETYSKERFSKQVTFRLAIYSVEQKNVTSTFLTFLKSCNFFVSHPN